MSQVLSGEATGVLLPEGDGMTGVEGRVLSIEKQMFSRWCKKADSVLLGVHEPVEQKCGFEAENSM